MHACAPLTLAKNYRVREGDLGRGPFIINVKVGRLASRKAASKNNCTLITCSNLLHNNFLVNIMRYHVISPAARERRTSGIYTITFHNVYAKIGSSQVLDVDDCIIMRWFAKVPFFLLCSFAKTFLPFLAAVVLIQRLLNYFLMRLLLWCLNIKFGDATTVHFFFNFFLLYAYYCIEISMFLICYFENIWIWSLEFLMTFLYTP